MYVYFIQIGDSGDIKIGYTNNIKKRLKELQTGSPKKLKLLGYIDGGRTKEQELHSQFKQYRVNGEWFRLHQEIVDYINKNTKTNTWIELDSGKTSVLMKMSR